VTTLAGDTTLTDANGVYKLSGLSPSTLNGYSLEVEAAGYETPAPKRASAFAGYSDQVDFYPTPITTAACPLSTVDPSVTFCTPTANATVSSPIHVVAGATSSKAVSYMQLYVDGIKQFQVAAKTLDTTVAAASGTRKLTVQFKDTAGVITKNTIFVTVGTTGSTGGGTGPTTVTITSPASGATVTSPVHVSATVSASVAIAFTQVYVDGISMYTVNGKTVDTTFAMTPGAHRLTVQTKDSAGVITKATESITVQ
jgi:hypothetical protein